MEIQEITLNNHEIQVKVLTLGGIITHFSHTKDAINTILRFKDTNDYIINRGFLGAMVGPLAGRTENATFTLDNKAYHLDQNVPPHHLHGGKLGLSKQTFKVISQTDTTLVLEDTTDYTQTGYPGSLTTQIKYSLHLNSLLIETTATPTASMPINITNHSYFNLDQSESIADHSLQVIADEVVFVSENGSNCDNIQKVDGTPFDLNETRKIGDLLKQTHPQFDITRHLDHTYLSNPRSKVLLKNSDNSKELLVEFDTPAFQIYLANYFDGTLTKENGKKMNPHAGVAIEPQNVPNEINIWGKKIYTTDSPFKSTIKYTLNV